MVYNNAKLNSWYKLKLTCWLIRWLSASMNYGFLKIFQFPKHISRQSSLQIPANMHKYLWLILLRQHELRCCVALVANKSIHISPSFFPSPYPKLQHSKTSKQTKNPRNLSLHTCKINSLIPREALGRTWKRDNIQILITLHSKWSMCLCCIKPPRPGNLLVHLSFACPN